MSEYVNDSLYSQAVAFSQVPSGIAFADKTISGKKSIFKYRLNHGSRLLWLLWCMPRLHVAGDQVTTGSGIVF